MKGGGGSSLSVVWVKDSFVGWWRVHNRHLCCGDCDSKGRARLLTRGFSWKGIFWCSTFRGENKSSRDVAEGDVDA